MRRRIRKRTFAHVASVDPGDPSAVESSIVGNESVPVAWVSNRIEGDLVAGLLRGEGISARVNADDAGGQEPQLQLQSGAQVLVAPADEARAREILADLGHN